MDCVVVGLNIKSAPFELLEKLSVHHSLNEHCVQDLKQQADVSAAVVLSTCNRLEFYATAEDPDHGVESVWNYFISQGEAINAEEQAILRECMYAYTGDMAVRHLFEVVTGLDSLIVGEAEILGQVSRAYKAACRANTTDKLLNVWFQRALHLGKMARHQTDINRFSMSVGRIAVDLAVKELGGVEDKCALILGAGEMSELTVKYLVANKVSVAMVSNRSLDKAMDLAGRYGFEAHALGEVAPCLERADVVFSATSSKNYMVDFEMAKQAMEKRPDRPLLFLDMAVPRDIDPRVAELDGVSVYNINELRDEADRNRLRRAAAEKGVRRLIEEAVAEFRHWAQSLELVPVIAAFRARAEEIKQHRLEVAYEQMPSLSASQRKQVRVLATTITDEFLKMPVESLNAAAGSPKSRDYARMLQELFALDVVDNNHQDAQAKRAAEVASANAAEPRTCFPNPASANAASSSASSTESEGA